MPAENLEKLGGGSVNPRPSRPQGVYFETMPYRFIDKVKLEEARYEAVKE